MRPSVLARRPGGAIARPPRLLCVSLHDLTPAQASALDGMVRLCREAEIDRLSLLVVPDWHRAAPLEPGPFAEALCRLVEAGSELVLHGLCHRMEGNPALGLWGWLKAVYFAAREGEFYALDEDEAGARLDDGLRRLASAGLARPEGFVAPAWLASAGARRAIAARGFGWHEDTLRVYDLARGRSHFSPVVGFAPRRALEREALIAYAGLMSRLLAGASLLRVAIHPPDVTDRRTAAALRRLLMRERTRRELVTYRDALARLAGDATPA